MEPNFGSVDLSAGFAPDPHKVEITGGEVDVSATDIGIDYTGYATAAPDFRLNWSGSSEALRTFFVAEEVATMVVNMGKLYITELDYAPDNLPQGVLARKLLSRWSTELYMMLHSMKPCSVLIEKTSVSTT